MSHRTWTSSLAVSLAMTAYGAIAGYAFAAWLGPIGSVPCAIIGLAIGTILQALIVGRKT